MIQLTEKEARKLLEMGRYLSRADIDSLLCIWKEKGFIRKTKLEEAREFFEKNVSGCNFEDEKDFIMLKILYEDAIKEIQDGKE